MSAVPSIRSATADRSLSRPLTQEQCRICAVTPDDVAEACAGQPAAKMVTIMPVTLDDVMNDVITIATALGVPERGERLVALLRARLETIDTVTGYSSES